MKKSNVKKFSKKELTVVPKLEIAKLQPSSPKIHDLSPSEKQKIGNLILKLAEEKELKKEIELQFKELKQQFKTNVRELKQNNKQLLKQTVSISNQYLKALNIIKHLNELINQDNKQTKIVQNDQTYQKINISTPTSNKNKLNNQYLDQNNNLSEEKQKSSKKFICTKPGRSIEYILSKNSPLKEEKLKENTNNYNRNWSKQAKLEISHLKQEIDKLSFSFSKLKTKAQSKETEKSKWFEPKLNQIVQIIQNSESKQIDHQLSQPETNYLQQRVQKNYKSIEQELKNKLVMQPESDESDSQQERKLAQRLIEIRKQNTQQQTIDYQRLGSTNKMISFNVSHEQSKNAVQNFNLSSSIEPTQQYSDKLQKYQNLIESIQKMQQSLIQSTQQIKNPITSQLNKQSINQQSDYNITDSSLDFYDEQLIATIQEIEQIIYWDQIQN